MDLGDGEQWVADVRLARGPGDGAEVDLGEAAHARGGDVLEELRWCHVPRLTGVEQGEEALVDTGAARREEGDVGGRELT